MLKVAQYAAQLEDYEKAIQIYESVAGSCLDSSLLKYSAKEYFFRAALCHLSVDLLNAQHALEKYAQQYPAFQDSREFKLIKVRNQNCDFKLDLVLRWKELVKEIVKCLCLLCKTWRDELVNSRSSINILVKIQNLFQETWRNFISFQVNFWRFVTVTVSLELHVSNP